MAKRIALKDHIEVDVRGPEQLRPQRRVLS